MITKRIESDYYITIDMYIHICCVVVVSELCVACCFRFKADLQRMVDNCKFYNPVGKQTNKHCICSNVFF